jgi:hypothetical protein
MPNFLPADFAQFDEEQLPEELPVDFAGFDEDRPPGSLAAEASSRCVLQSCAAPGEALGSSQLLERVPGEVRSLVTSFAEILGATVTHVVPRGAPDPVFPRGAAHGWDAWRRQRDDRIFARAREASRGKSFYERLRETEEEEKRERLRRKEWLDRQRRIAHGWAKWAGWRAVAPADAERFRMEHEDGRIDWLVDLAARRAPLGRAPRTKGSKGDL